MRLLSFLAVSIFMTFSATDSVAQSKQSCAVTCANHVKTAKVIFKKNKVYEIVYFSLTPGKEKQVFEKYMPKATPYFEKYGVKTIGMFSVIESRSDILKSEMIGIFEWPNYEAKEQLEADKGFQKVAELRDGSFSFFKGGWFSTEKDTEVIFTSDKVYEVGGATLLPTEEAKASLGKYFEVSEPIKRNYGGSYPKFLVNLGAADSKGTATYNNEMQFIVEWDSVEDNQKLFADKDFKTKAAPILESALERADFVFGKYIFN